MSVRFIKKKKKTYYTIIHLFLHTKSPRSSLTASEYSRKSIEIMNKLLDEILFNGKS